MSDPEFVTKMQKFVGHLEAARNVLARGSLDYYATKLAEHSSALLGEFCPFKIGQEARIVKDVPCTGDWKSSQRHLCKGTLGYVHDVDYYDGSFQVYFVPYVQWWQDTYGNWHEQKALHSYCIRGEYLVPVNQEKDAAAEMSPPDPESQPQTPQADSKPTDAGPMSMRKSDERFPKACHSKVH